MIRFFCILVSILIAVGLIAKDKPTDPDIVKKRVRNYIKKGNEEFRSEHYSDAEILYQMALEEDSTSEIAKYNLALSMIRQNPITKSAKADDSERMDSDKDKMQDPLAIFEKLSESTNKNISQKSLVCLGNASFNKEDFSKSIDYYKKALRIDPNDMVARKNLRAAQLMLPPSQNNNNQDSDKNNKQENNQQQNQKQDKEDNNKDQNNNNDKNKDNKDNKNNTGSPNKDNNPNPNDNKQSGGQKSQSGSMSRENIEKILQSAQRQEDNTRKKVEQAKQGNSSRSTNRPW